MALAPGQLLGIHCWLVVEQMGSSQLKKRKLHKTTQRLNILLKTTNIHQPIMATLGNLNGTFRPLQRTQLHNVQLLHRTKGLLVHIEPRTAAHCSERHSSQLMVSLCIPKTINSGVSQEPRIEPLLIRTSHGEKSILPGDGHLDPLQPGKTRLCDPFVGET